MKWLAIVGLFLGSSCGFESAREAEIVNAITSADEVLLRTRPILSEQKYVAMAESRYAFWRGTVPLFRHDAISGDVGRTSFESHVLPAAHGDPHMENFGTLLGADGELALEANDFDGSDRLPYHWDLRRLTVGLVIAAELSNESDSLAREQLVASAPEIAGAAALSYARSIRAYADGGPIEPLFDDDTTRSPLVRDLFRRARRDREERAELETLTLLTGSGRRLRRGVLDPEDPSEYLTDVPAFADEPLRRAVESYRDSLPVQPPADFFRVLDAARQIGGGVASLPRLRVLILVRGESDDPSDDVLLELKELSDSGAPSILPGLHQDTVAERVMRGSRAAWGEREAEPLWGVSELLGVPVQIRREAEMHKTLRVSRLEDEEGTLGATLELAVELGHLLARIHATPLDGVNAAIPIADAIDRARSEFVQQETRVALAYAARQRRDFELFQAALARRGPLLGMERAEERFDVRSRPEADRLFDAVDSEAAR